MLWPAAALASMAAASSSTWQVTRKGVGGCITVKSASRSMWRLKASSSTGQLSWNAGEQQGCFLLTFVLLKPMKALTQLHPPES